MCFKKYDFTKLSYTFILLKIMSLMTLLCSELKCYLQGWCVYPILLKAAPVAIPLLGNTPRKATEKGKSTWVLMHVETQMNLNVLSFSFSQSRSCGLLGNDPVCVSLCHCLSIK